MRVLGMLDYVKYGLASYLILNLFLTDAVYSVMLGTSLGSGLLMGILYDKIGPRCKGQGTVRHSEIWNQSGFGFGFTYQ